MNEKSEETERTVIEGQLSVLEDHIAELDSATTEALLRFESVLRAEPEAEGEGSMSARLIVPLADRLHKLNVRLRPSVERVKDMTRRCEL